MHTHTYNCFPLALFGHLGTFVYIVYTFVRLLLGALIYSIFAYKKKIKNEDKKTINIWETLTLEYIWFMSILTWE